jgi:DNA repair exonuclease SbcCD ATPase subunit
MSYRITTATITDFKRLKSIEITPPADASIILIGGKNAQGKSSILDAFTAAIGGGRALPADPIRHGAKEASIFVEFDGGKLTIDRVINKKGSSLEVRDADGVVKSPQALLDKLVGARFLDPLAFLQLAAKDQRAQLMKLIEGAERIDGLNDERAKAFDRRTEIGRDLAKAEGELARLPEVDVGKAIDVAALNDELRKFADVQREGDGLGNAKALAAQEATAAQMRVEKSKATIAELENKLRIERDLLVRDESNLAAAFKAEEVARCNLANAADSWSLSAERRAQLDADLKRAADHNRSIYEAEGHMKRRAEASKTVEVLKADVDKLKGVLAVIDRRKAEILGAAKLPVDGLAVTDDGVELGGVPFAQASGAERLRVALSLAIAASPNLDDVWIRDGALLDEESLEQVAKHAAASKKRVWIERVGTSDAGVIVISDGQVAS